MRSQLSIDYASPAHALAETRERFRQAFSRDPANVKAEQGLLLEKRRAESKAP